VVGVSDRRAMKNTFDAKQNKLYYNMLFAFPTNGITAIFSSRNFAYVKKYKYVYFHKSSSIFFEILFYL
jgi:hypothetical protein